MPTHGHNVRIWKQSSSGTGPAKGINTSNYNTLTTVSSGGSVNNASWNSAGFTSYGTYEKQTGAGDPMGFTEFVGNGSSHNNMPPYIVVSIWKRTA